MTTLPELQKSIDHWICGNAGGYWTEFQILARLMEELGELSSDLQRESGLRPRKADTDLEGEVGDLLFTLIAFANKMDIDLESALQKVLKKYDIRDVSDWKDALGKDGES